MAATQIETPTRKFYVYLHCKPDGTPFYVGKGHGNRATDFVKGRSVHHKNTVALLGGKGCISVHIFPCLSEAQALSDEISHIHQLRTEGYPLVNKTIGGDGVCGLIHSDETRAKISKKLAGKKRGPMSAETRAKIGLFHKGRTKGIPKPEHSARMTGRKLTESHKAAIGRGHSGMKRSESARAAMSAAQRGHFVSDEARANMSAAHKGQPLSNAQISAYMSEGRSKKIGEAHRGKVITQETRDKISATKKAAKFECTPEHRAKLSACAKAQWEIRKCK